MKHLSIRLISVGLLLVLSSLLVFAQWTDGQNATFVIGQADFTSKDSPFPPTATSLADPKDVAIDVANGKLYVADMYTHRVLRYAYPITGNQPVAELVFGQPNFTSSLSGTTQNTFWEPHGLTVDSTGRLWVADLKNNRVVWFNSAHTIAANQPHADGVLGQPDFTSNGAATTQSGMNWPIDIAVDTTGTLFVGEYKNNRVLRFDNAAGKANGANADGVLGQPDFTSNGSATTQNGMYSPRGVALFGTTLFVADRSNCRVLRFDNAVNKANGANADGVLGQPDFTSSACVATQSGMGHCGRVVVDGCGRLYVSDAFYNNRVLIYDDAVSKANGAPADNVLGQPNFTSSGRATAQNRFDMDSSGAGLAVDVVNRRLLVADDNNNRVMHFQASEALGCGTIIVEKQTDPPGGTGFGFTDNIATPNNFGLDHGWTRTFNNVAIGSYTVSETDPMEMPEGYALTNLNCVETGANNSVRDVGTRTATINLESGETVTCTFTNTKQPLLTVNKVGDGSGTVTSEPVGINCGADCTEYYLENTVVILTAHPGMKSYFVGWSEDCIGTEHTAQVTMDADKTCTATFGYPIGGVVVPVDKLGLVAPWMGVAALAGLVALGVVLVRRRSP